MRSAMFRSIFRLRNSHSVLLRSTPCPPCYDQLGGYVTLVAREHMERLVLSLGLEPNSALESVLATFISRGVSEELMRAQPLRQTMFSRKEVENCPEIIDLLLQRGFKLRQIWIMVSKWPGLIGLERYELSNFLDFLGSNVMLLNPIELLTKYPHLTAISVNDLADRVNRIAEHFPQRKVKYVLQAAPNLLLGSWETHKKTFDFVSKYLGFGTDSPVREYAVFLLPLEEIRTRYFFAHRAGLPLSFDLSGDVSTFVRRAGLTEEEYRVFGDLLVLEDLEVEEDMAEEEEEMKLPHHPMEERKAKREMLAAKLLEKRKVEHRRKKDPTIPSTKK